jgi:hypothetical protein
MLAVGLMSRTIDRMMICRQEIRLLAEVISSYLPEIRSLGVWNKRNAYINDRDKLKWG